MRPAVDSVGGSGVSASATDGGTLSIVALLTRGSGSDISQRLASCEPRRVRHTLSLSLASTFSGASSKDASGTELLALKSCLGGWRKHHKFDVIVVKVVQSVRFLFIANTVLLYPDV